MSYADARAQVPLSQHDELRWIVQEGHLPYVWTLAETAAAAMGADQIRIDIFVRRGDPSAVAVNEISLHSGAPMHFHAEFAAKLWAEFHGDGQHMPYAAGDAWRAKTPGTALYELGIRRGSEVAAAAATSVPNEQAVRQGLRKMGAWSKTLEATVAPCVGSAH